jgi:hypothetical protein
MPHIDMATNPARLALMVTRHVLVEASRREDAQTLPQDTMANHLETTFPTA